MKSNQATQRITARLCSPRAGFNFGEVVIASIIIALMMTWLFNYVDIAGVVWQKSHYTVNLTNEANALLDTIERELWHATECSEPAIGLTSTQIQYGKKVSDYQAVASTTVLDFRIIYDTAEKRVYTEVATNTPRWTTTAVGNSWVVGTTNNVKTLVAAQHNYDMTRNVLGFSVTREANRLLKVTARLGVTAADGSLRYIEVKRSLMIR